ncbi:MAG: YkgJ family cysteine cluster protein [Candidatus Omnitrophica bacterium]|nr:YkgJ family cysteine cluster protein [Candidatus Omnitrophota bacterium]
MIFSDFPQLVPQKICLSCQGCCRFKDARSVWRPKVAPAEIEANEHKEDFTGALGEDGYIKTVQEQGQNRCAFLNLGTNQCGIYTGRPFECRLYPFLLTGKEGNIVVSVHLSCSYVQQNRYTVEFECYLAVLQGYLFREKNFNFFRNNPAMLGDYSGYSSEIEELFTVGPREKDVSR